MSDKDSRLIWKEKKRKAPKDGEIQRQSNFAGYVNNHRAYHFKATDMKRWLPLFYLIPYNFFPVRRQLLQISRYPHDVIRTDKYDELIYSDVYAEFIMEAYAQYIWKFLKVPKKNGAYRYIPESMNSYSGYSTLWKLPYGIVAYVLKELEKMDHGIAWLFSFKKNMEHRWISEIEFIIMIEKLVKLIVSEQNYQPIIDALWETRNMEDFYGESNLMIDAKRKWYHTRAKTKTVSLEKIMNKEANDDYTVSQETLLSMSDPFAEFENTSVMKEELKSFTDTLTDKDMDILRMKYDGYKLQEIADELGFQTHSAVSKRLKKLGEKYEDYVGEKFDDYLK